MPRLSGCADWSRGAIRADRRIALDHSAWNSASRASVASSQPGRSPRGRVGSPGQSGKLLRPSTTAIRMSLTPPGFELVDYLEPEFGAFALFDPKAQDFFSPTGLSAGATQTTLILNRPSSRILTRGASKHITR